MPYLSESHKGGVVVLPPVESHNCCESSGGDFSNCNCYKNHNETISIRKEYFQSQKMKELQDERVEVKEDEEQGVSEE